MTSPDSPSGRQHWHPGTRTEETGDSFTRRDPPGREARAAQTGTRRIWYGYGQLSRAEKDGFGVFLHDVIRIYGEVSIIGLPLLLVVWVYPTTAFLDITAMAMMAWLTMTLLGTLVRGGWVHPLWTETPGWVTLAPTLLVFRLVYFNLTLAISSFGGLSLAALAGTGLVGLLWSGGFAALAMLLFPRTAEEWMSRWR